LRILLNDVVQQGDNPPERSFVIVLSVSRDVGGLVQLVEETNLVLGIGASGARIRCARDKGADIAERGQPLTRFGIDIGGRHRGDHFPEAPFQRPQSGDHAFAEWLPLSEQVRRLIWIAFDVIELGARSIDDFVASRAECVKIAPAVVMQRIHRFRIGVERELGFCSGKQRHEADTRDPRCRRCSQQIEHGRHDVD
jgi:hypothetical protein